MQKCYVLLRHDKQTGPYSLEELIQFDLKPYDLIWIEGQSAGWWYPQEIAALHPYLNFLPKKPAVNKPAQPVAEEKTTSPAFVPAPPIYENNPYAAAPVSTPLAPEPAKKYQPVEPFAEKLEAAVYAQFQAPGMIKEPTVSFAPATPQKSAPNALVVGTITVLIVGGVFAASWIMNRQPGAEKKVTEMPVMQTPGSGEIDPPAAAMDDNIQKTGAYFPAAKKKTNSGTFAAATNTAGKLSAKQPKEEKKAEYEAAEATTYPTTGKAVPAEPDAVPETSSTTEETTHAPQEKKKSLKDKFLDLFRKKEDEKPAEERRAAETENGERTATRRESNLLQMVHVRFDVPNDWMMGIKGAKATMVNRSGEKITSATIEVLYYNDDNELLQKKTVTFGKIGAKDARTVPIPDHPTATRVDYQISSVTGDEKPSA